MLGRELTVWCILEYLFQHLLPTNCGLNKHEQAFHWSFIRQQRLILDSNSIMGTSTCTVFLAKENSITDPLLTNPATAPSPLPQL